ncbi:MAG: acetoacetyl-CoA reductase [Thermoproteota archaeon]|nr:acetoacetyl-CoA reductase [Thermoproteota archaeon]
MGRLEGRVAIITGCGWGFGEAIAKLFAEQGATVSICDVISVRELKKNVESKIESTGGKALCFQTDVTKENRMNTIERKTIEKFGSVDVLVNNVGNSRTH